MKIKYVYLYKIQATMIRFVQLVVLVSLNNEVFLSYLSLLICYFQIGLYSLPPIVSYGAPHFVLNVRICSTLNLDEKVLIETTLK